MRLLNCLLPALALAAALHAQKPTDLFSKAPPEMEQALRANITTFYQAHVDGKPRRAEAVIAEDSKDYFYNSRKPTYLGFEINDIKYADSFTKATVVTVIETMIPMMSLANKPVKVPLASLWKIEDGKWCWYIDPDKVNMTPFGKMGTPSNVTKGGSSALPDVSKGPDVAAVLKQVAADKNVVVFKIGEASTEEVIITNSMPGSVTLALPDPPVPGVDVSLSKKQLNAGEKCTVAIHYTPGRMRPRAFPVNVEVKPINHYITFRLQFR